MKNLFTVSYRKNPNPYKTYAQNANRRAGFRSFETLGAALEFAATVDAVRIFDNTGKIVAQF